MKSTFPDLIKNLPIYEQVTKKPFFKSAKKFDFTKYDNQDVALFIRVGMGLLFIFGGGSKLSQ